jgi:uncharacterized membrane protein YjfL (UPF0719 family)
MLAKKRFYGLSHTSFHFSLNEQFAWAGLTEILLILAFPVARITVMSHWCQLFFFFLDRVL